jgi:UDP-GlcNAc:undecaprenyl-phosphate/decaprenyl-phosphate GlcNAc-1-phosphate transferase
LTYLSALLLSFFITVILIPVFCRLTLRFNVGLDIPDARKVHDQPVPRVGGIAIALGVYGSTVLWMPQSDFVRAYAIGTGFLVLFGLLDDFKGLDFRVKFLAQFIAALVVVIYGGIKISSLGNLLPEGILLPDAVAVPFTVIAIVGVTNAVNLADGLDGLAGGICLLSFCCVGYLSYIGENMTISLLGVALVGSILGFLRYNTHPAELFLGDTGSQFLGFSAITLSLALTQESSPFSPLLPVLILGFPVLDTLTVIVHRLVEKRPVFAADKRHFHHRLMGLGFHHSESVVAIYILQALLIIGAYLFRFESEWLILSAYIILSFLILLGFYVADKTYWKMHRYPFFDHLIKGRVKMARDRGILIRSSFRVMQFGMPLFLFVNCLAPSEIPPEFGVLCLAFILLLSIVWRFRRNWMRGSLMVVLYLFVPFIVFLGVERENSFGEFIHSFFNVSYVGLALFAILTLKLTRRQRGFKTTPMDFLIVFIALVFPHFLGTYLPVKDLPVVVTKTIMFFFGFEVLMGELRGRLGGLALASAAVLLTVAIRGLAGW